MDGPAFVIRISLGVVSMGREERDLTITRRRYDSCSVIYTAMLRVGLGGTYGTEAITDKAGCHVRGG